MGTDVGIGSVVGNYVVESLIGRGGMGVVYEAQHLRLKRSAALKLLAPELAAEAGFRERFDRESQLAATMEHPNIIPVYDAGEAEGTLYIAMRLVRGSDLRTTIERESTLDAERTMYLLGRVASALDYAHEEGLVHRDVKPGNILIEPSSRGGDKEHVWLTDFGLVIRRDATSRLTKTGSFLGTVVYAAPEQFESREVDGRADQYSLACVLYECLTGLAPFERDSEGQIMFAHLREPPPRITVLRKDLPAGLDAVFQRAMAKKPEDRYGSCGEMVAEASAALSKAQVIEQHHLAPPPMPPLPPPMPVVRPQQPPAHSQPPQGAAHPAGPQHQAGRPPVRPDAPVVTHHGNLYALGYVGNAYVIWDRKSPSSGPIQRFPRTPVGWKAAWRQFQAMEGAAQGRTTGPTHPQWQAVIPGRRHTNASLIMALLSLFPVLGLAFGAIGIALGAHATKRGDRRGSTAVAANVIGLILDAIFIVAIAANQG